MKKKIIGILVCTLLIATVLPVTGTINVTKTVIEQNSRQERDYGDAPEGDGAIAYPWLGVIGSFPTCKCCGPASWIEHNNFGGWFGQGVDFEPEGNGGLCPQCFPPYDQDETFQDGDAGLIIPDPYTIDNSLNIVPIPPGVGTPLGLPGQTAVWGTDVDILVHNTMPNHEPYVEGYVNVLMDWNQNGIWNDDPSEHVLINFLIPPLYIGPLSGLAPPNFAIGPNPGYVWTRFSITERPVAAGWKGDGEFEDGESEDYLLEIADDTPPEPKLECRGSLRWSNIKPGSTVTDTFEVRNNGDPGSLLNWHVDTDPSYGTWSYSPSSGTNLAPSSWVTVTATCTAPNTAQTTFTGDIIVCNSDDPTECCSISTSLATPRNRAINNFIMLFFEKLFEQIPMLKLIR